MIGDLIQPKEQEFTLPDGTAKLYILSKFDAVTGREIVTQYPITATPKIGDYRSNEELMLRVMAHVAIPFDGSERKTLRLTSRELVNNHVPDFETLLKIEMAMMEYNCSFFARGGVSSLFEKLTAKVPQLIMKMLTDFSVQSSGNGKQP